MSARRRMVRLLAAASTAFALFRSPSTAAARTALAATDPAGLLTAEQLPPLAQIEAAAAQFHRATEQARTADRGKRAARKLLDRLPAGRYGAWQIERPAGARETVDLEAVRAIFAANGLGPVPVKPCAPSLKVTRAEAEQQAAEAGVRVLTGAAA